MLAGARLTFRMNRLEMSVVVAATLLSVAVSALVLAWMAKNNYASCLTGTGDQPFRAFCNEALSIWMSRLVQAAISLIPIFPFAAGVLLGGPIVARELESGTARLAWSLAPSRMRWLIARAAPALILAVGTAYAIGVVGDALYAAVNPAEDVSKSFVGYGGRGLLVAANAALVGGIALFVGAWFGRLVPAFVVTIVLGGLLIYNIDNIHRQLLIDQAVVLSGDTYSSSDLQLAYRFQMADGRVVTWEQLVAIRPEAATQGPSEPSVNLVIPGDRYHSVEAQAAAVRFALAAVFVAAGSLIVLRRRPR